jgi:DNA-directed RNA polymerase sigma subunit (sigma70/sigma32)
MKAHPHRRRCNLHAASLLSGGTARYLQQIRRLSMLEPDEESMLERRWHEHGDSNAAQKLVTSHLRLVAKIATGYRGYGLPISDLISEGNVGLMQAVKRFNPEKACASLRTPSGGSRRLSRNTFCARGRWCESAPLQIRRS